MSATRNLHITLHLLEEVVEADLLEEFGTAPTRVSQEILDFLRASVARINTHPEMTVSAVAPDHIPSGDITQVEVLLCSPSAFEELLEQPVGVIGVHLVSTPDTDPFGDDAPYARAYRVAIPFDAGVIMEKIRDAVADFDGVVDEAALVHGAMGWLVTLPHEIHHVLWFAGNGSFNAPADLDVMEGDIGYDVFDITTGYGLRPPVIDGEEVEPEGAEDAADLLEEMVEERGRMMAEQIFDGDLSPQRFLSLLHLEIENNYKFAKNYIENDYPNI